MNSRERFLLIGVISAVVIAGAVFLLPEDFSITSPFSGGDLDSARRTFRDDFDWIKKGPAIRRDYQRVEAQFPERVGTRTPESTFSDELAKMLTEKGVLNPAIKAPEQAFIEGVEDYYYIDLEVRLFGELPQMIDILTQFHQKGLLIKSLELRKSNPDVPKVQLDVRVSRLAKLDETQKKKQKKTRRAK